MKYLIGILVTLLSLSIGFVARGDNPSIFRIEDIKGEYFGTAFVLNTRQGPVTVTNKHVCGNNKTMIIERHKPERYSILIVKKVSQINDLCVLTAPIGVLPLNMGYDYFKGDVVVAEGFPLGEHRISKGLIGRKLRVPQESLVLVHITTLVDFGSSGSPVTNRSGDVIGVVSAKCTSDQCGKNTSFMVPLEYLKDFVDSE